MDNGQADTGPDTIEDLAQFLADNPEADADDSADEEKRAKPSEESDEDNSEETPEDASADEDEEPSEDAEKQPSTLKFKVPVKGDDGTETTVEVDQKELIAGYQRHADYTRKTMELADKEREAFSVVTAKIEEGRNHYLQQAQVAQAAVMQLAGLRSPQEMAALAQSDPALWVQEQQREVAVRGVIAQLQQNMQQEQRQSEMQRQQALQQQFHKAWGVLGKEGIDKPKLAKIYETVSSKYGIEAEKLANVYDPALVLLMRDAAAYQGLKDKKAEVVKKAQDAPRLPAARQNVPKNELRNKALNQRFASGKAKLGDLAAWIESNNL